MGTVKKLLIAIVVSFVLYMLVWIAMTPRKMGVQSMDMAAPAQAPVGAPMNRDYGVDRAPSFPQAVPDPDELHRSVPGPQAVPDPDELR